MRRFFYEQSAAVGNTITLKAEDSKHITKVLRQNLGDRIEIVAGEQVYLGEIVALGNAVSVLLQEAVEVYREAPLQVYLLQGIAKGERMDLVIQKAVELGVTAIIPVACSRCVVQLPGERAKEKQKRWQKIAESAAKQCGRQKITKILPVSTLQEALQLLPAGAKLLMPWEEADAAANDATLQTALQGEAPDVAAVIIGPEGGLTEEEVALAKEAGATILTLGKRILRTETAAIVMIAILMYVWGDIGGKTER